MKTTYPIISFILLIVALISCKKDPSQGLPDQLIVNKADSALITRTDTILQNNGAAVDLHPVLFDSTYECRVVVSTETEVFVTFLYEGAAWENSLGYYIYNENESPSIADKHILFPNISGSGGGGALVAGDMVQVGVGKFPKGTVIGFFLVAQGWEDGHIMPGIYTHYTDKIFNINKVKQSILFVEKKTGKMVLGFEDMASTSGGGDYNDVVVSVSDNKDPNVAPTSFDLTKVPQL